MGKICQERPDRPLPCGRRFAYERTNGYENIKPNEKEKENEKENEKEKEKEKERENIYISLSRGRLTAGEKYIYAFPWGIKILLSFFLCLCYYMDDKVCVPAFDYEQEE